MSTPSQFPPQSSSTPSLQPPSRIPVLRSTATHTSSNVLNSAKKVAAGSSTVGSSHRKAIQQTAQKWDTATATALAKPADATAASAELDETKQQQTKQREEEEEAEEEEEEEREEAEEVAEDEDGEDEEGNEHDDENEEQDDDDGGDSDDDDHGEEDDKLQHNAVHRSPPKRAMTGYMLFSQDQLAQLKKEQPSLSTIAVLKELGTRWLEADSYTKQQYNKAAEAHRRRANAMAVLADKAKKPAAARKRRVESVDGDSDDEDEDDEEDDEEDYLSVASSEFSDDSHSSASSAWSHTSNPYQQPASLYGSRSTDTLRSNAAAAAALHALCDSVEGLSQQVSTVTPLLTFIKRSLAAMSLVAVLALLVAPLLLPWAAWEESDE